MMLLTIDEYVRAFIGFALLQIFMFCGSIEGTTRVHSISSVADTSTVIYIDCEGPSWATNVEWWVQPFGQAAKKLIQHCPTCHEYTITSTTTVMKINGVRSRNEGLYYCTYQHNNAGLKYRGNVDTNLTILGRAIFPNCYQKVCGNAQQIVTEGSSFIIEVPLVFIGGGKSGAKQQISYIRISNKERFPSSFFYCSFRAKSCTVRNNSPYSERTTHLKGNVAPSYTNIQIKVDNSTFEDKGVYELVANAYFPTLRVNREVTLNLPIEVTQAPMPSSTLAHLPSITPTTVTPMPSNSIATATKAPSHVMSKSPGVKYKVSSTVVKVVTTTSTVTTSITTTVTVTVTPSPAPQLCV